MYKITSKQNIDELKYVMTPSRSVKGYQYKGPTGLLCIFEASYRIIEHGFKYRYVCIKFLFLIS